jgi:glutaconate CoA-transferase subunit B
LRGDGEREKAGLIGGPARVITDKAVFDFDPETKRMRLEAIHPNTTLEDVLSNMAFQPVVPSHVPETEPPTAEQLRLIREEIDPDKLYAGG